MVVKIFYFVIAIFSVVMVFLVSSDPYFAEQFKPDLNASSMQMSHVTDYEINATMISAKYEADEVNRYKDRDEFMKFRAEILRGAQKHDISSNKAVVQGSKVQLLGDARYENNESLRFFSQQVDYDTKTKIAVSPVEFVMTRGQDRATGASGSYDIEKKQTNIKGLKAWVEQEK